jgi:hypothetical protein
MSRASSSGPAISVLTRSRPNVECVAKVCLVKIDHIPKFRGERRTQLSIALQMVLMVEGVECEPIRYQR